MQVPNIYEALPYLGSVQISSYFFVKMEITPINCFENFCKEPYT